jgi:hypothetical protein
MYLVLLTSSSDGYIFDKEEIKSNIRSERWRLAGDDNYKINSPLPLRNGFSGFEAARSRMIGAQSAARETGA